MIEYLYITLCLLISSVCNIHDHTRDLTPWHTSKGVVYVNEDDVVNWKKNAYLAMWTKTYYIDVDGIQYFREDVIYTDCDRIEIWHHKGR